LNEPGVSTTASGGFAVVVACSADVAQRDEKAAERRTPKSLSQVRKDARDDLAVLERIARAGRRLRAIGERPPAAIGGARDVDRIDMQPGNRPSGLRPWQGQRKFG
jgi:hypothetical protein